MGHFNSEQQDFFKSTALAPASFAFAYDYTFLCALPPSMHLDWAARYAELMQPGGALVTLMFPIGMHTRRARCELA